MWVEFTLLCFSLFALWFIYSKIMDNVRSSYWTSKGIPYLKNGTKWMDILTGKKSIFDQDFYKQLQSLKAGCGGIYTQGQQTLFIISPDLIRAVFVKDADHFIDRREFKTADPMLSKMVIALKGKEWKDVRSFLTPTFTSGKIRRMFEQFNSSGKRLKEHVENIQKIDPGTGSHIIIAPEASSYLSLQK